MRERMRIQSDMEKLLAKFGFNQTFTWKEAKKLNLENSAIYFAHGNALLVVGRTKMNNKLYKINSEYFKCQKKYRLLSPDNHLLIC